MSSSTYPTCKTIRPAETYDGKQGFSYIEGICAESAGSKGIAMMLVTVPPGGRAKAHFHEAHETAIYVITGEATTYWGETLENAEVQRAGDMFYIPAGVPHVPVNTGTVPCTAVIARTDPNEQESVVLTPELDRLVP